MSVLQKLQRRKSFLGFLAIGAVGLASLAAIGGRTGDYAATVEAASPSALERKVDNLQKNLKTMQTKLNRSVARVAELEMMLDGVLLGEIPVADADTLDGLDSTEFVLASEELADRVDQLEDGFAAIIEGAVPVGDSLRLGGRDSSEYLIASDLQFGEGLERNGNEVKIDLVELRRHYLPVTGGTISGNLRVEGDVRVYDGLFVEGSLALPIAAAGQPAGKGLLRYNDEFNTVEVNAGGVAGTWFKLRRE